MVFGTKYCKTPIIRVLEIFWLFASSKKPHETYKHVKNGKWVTCILTFDAKITSAWIAGLDDSAKISCREL